MPFLGPPGAVEVGDASRKRGQEGGGPSSSRPGLPGHAVTMATDVAQGPLGAGSPRVRSPGPGGRLTVGIPSAGSSRSWSTPGRLSSTTG